MWCWRKIEKFRWTDCVRNGEVLHKDHGMNILHTTNSRKDTWFWSCRNCLLKHITEGKIECLIELTTRRGRSKRLLNDLREGR
jgi:Zn-finger protein